MYRFLVLSVSLILSVFLALSSATADDIDAIISNSVDTGTQFSEEEETTSFHKVEDAFKPSVTVTDGQITIDWVIAPKYYLYQHQFAIEARTPEASESVELQFEPGKRKYDEAFEKELEVYYKGTKVTGQTTFQAPYQLKVASQGCADAGLCYPPHHHYFAVTEDGSISPIEKSQFFKSSSTTPTNPNDSGGTPQNVNQEEAPFLPFVLLGAILGGLILNLMPCVFPVLSLKALSLASSHLSSHKQHLHGWAYTAGVVGSFLVAASVILVARGAGESLGWGFQLQQPGFVAFMAYLFFVMGLSLSGYFYVGTSLMGAGQSLISGEGLKSSFFTGVLAALVASPCTAPFMATALGFALTQPAYIALLVFAALGFGMALPFILLSYSPHFAKALPQPGPWMDTLKQGLAFPLYLTAIWLLWVLSKQTDGSGAAAILVGAVLITFGIWLLQRHSGKIIVKGLGISSLVLAAAIGYKVDTFQKTDTGVWEKYTPERLAELRVEGSPVFIDLTADWCITCKYNEKVALNTKDVAKFVVLNDIYMLQGDWTNEDPEISELLEQFGRSGVPLYLMYPAKPNASPEVLPQLLTESMVLEAMERAL